MVQVTHDDPVRDGGVMRGVAAATARSTRRAIDGGAYTTLLNGGAIAAATRAAPPHALRAAGSMVAECPSLS